MCYCQLYYLKLPVHMTFSNVSLDFSLEDNSCYVHFEKIMFVFIFIVQQRKNSREILLWQFLGPSVHEAWGQLYCNANELWLFFLSFITDKWFRSFVFSPYCRAACYRAFSKLPFNLALTVLTLVMHLKKTQKHIKNNCRNRSILFVTIAWCKTRLLFHSRNHWRDIVISW